jgi:hypothetical protein
MSVTPEKIGKSSGGYKNTKPFVMRDNVDCLNDIWIKKSRHFAQREIQNTLNTNPKLVA